ncbi:hypothetical protein LDENG_00203990 [Lucifuga dentata]|nr:hypothetical protein LDENG_00203990 [Lucifuga dentata]
MSESKPSQRFHSLNAEQVEVLHQVLSEMVPIHGRGNFPTLELRPRDIIIAVRARLEKQGITVRDVRLNGSTASHVLVRDNGTSYKDLDIIFGVELPSQEEFQVIKESVLGCLLDYLPAGVNRERISSATMKEAYVQKMVKVFNEHDRWSLISLSNNSGKNLELKFVSTLRRQFEFSVDSFQIILDRLLESYLQQESQHRNVSVDQNRDSATQTAAPEAAGGDLSNEEAQIHQMEQRDEVGDEREMQKEPSEDIDNATDKDISDQTSLSLLTDDIETESQIQLRQKQEISDSLTKPEQSERTQPSDSKDSDQEVQNEPSNQTNPDGEQKELMKETPENSSQTQTEPLNLEKESEINENSDEGVVSERLSEDQRTNQKDETQRLPVPDASTSTHLQTHTNVQASERLSHMVVLKHSSPKPPRRMCRKVTSIRHPGPASESEPVIVPCLNPNPCPSPAPELALNIEPGTTTSSDFAPTAETNAGSETSPSTELTPKPDHVSAPDPAPDLTSTSVDPVSVLLQEPLPSHLVTEVSCETAVETLSTHVAFEEQTERSSEETASPRDQSEPPDSQNAVVSHADGSNTDTEDAVQTSEAEISDEDEIRELQTENMDLDQTSPKDSELSSSPHPGTPPVSCLTPPVLSLSPPCVTPSSRSLSPPPCLTPPSHCIMSSLLTTVSPAPSFSSPPLSFSPTSSCLSSPPYLTPPMLSLSPPLHCFSPPSPCLSPPLLCLTPPVETEDLVPQISSDLEPLILNTESEGPVSQPGSPLPQPEDKNEQDYIPSLPGVPEPVSFPITIPSSTSHLLPECPEESASHEDNEASGSESENKEPPKVTADMPEQSKAPQASDSVPVVEVLAESMYGDFEAAMDHLRYRLIATRNPEEIRGGGLLKYSNLLVRDYRPASETQIKTLERYMCSRFFIDFPDVQEQQRKILSYLKNHFIGEERSKYQYLMTLRRVVDDSTVCLMGHERRQTLNMITVLALKVLGEQNIIPNTDHVMCFYQPAPYLAEPSAPYLAEPSYCSYYIPQGGSSLLYQPYPLHLHPQTGLV